MGVQAGTPQSGAPLPARFFELVVAALGQAVVATDLGGVVRFWNPAAEALYGYRAEEAVGREIGDLIVPADARTLAAERAATLPNEPYAGDWVVQDRSGRAFTVYVTSTAIVEDGATVGMIGVSYDVTARRLAERDAHRLAAIVEGSGDAIIDTGPAGVIRSANAAVTAMLGYDPADLIGRNVGLLIPDELSAPVEAATAAVWAGGSPGVLLTRCPRADGTLIDVALRLSAVHDDAGDIVGISGITRDVTAETLTRAALEASERRSRARFEQTHVPQATLELDGTLAVVNDALCRLLGREHAELEGMSVVDLIHSTDANVRVVERLAAVQGTSSDAITWERIFTGPGGVPLPVVVHITVLREADDTPYGVAWFVQDLTLLRGAERALTRREAMFEAMERQASDWATVVDANGVLLYGAPRASGALGYGRGEVTGDTGWDHVHPDDRADVQRTFRQVAASAAGGGATVQFRAADTAGNWRWLENVLTNCLDDPDIGGIVCNCRDVTERVEAEQALRWRGQHDDLTGLANRTLIDDRIEHLLARRAHSDDNPLALIFVDLDQFKLINDSWGHATGDQLLVQVAARFAAAMRPGDTVARFGGDEFVIVCENTDETASQAIAARLQTTLGDPFDLDGRRAYVRASMGIAVSPPHAAPDLFRFADSAMYAAKAAGPGLVRLFDVELAEDAADQLTLGNDLRDALSNDELRLHYQPVVELATGRLVGLEALARWAHPVRGPVNPARFVAVAETNGLAPALNRWALRRACRDATQLRRLMKTVPRIAVNISLRHLTDTELEADVLAAVRDGGLGADGLTLEITESTLMDNPDLTCELLERLGAHGVETAIDDFGTGYSSLAYLARLPVATLKIDRGFIQHITDDPDSLAIAASVIDLARSMRLTTIAEGVETVEQLTLLRSLSCDAAQGFRWSPALAPSELAQLVGGLPDERFAVAPALSNT